ncbi:hypothetical protein C1M51_08090 [Methylibium sp. Pch-M]|uniref:hypothetical protein n=1 Tax=Methylibium sp. Pch-M TaxID=2082386 RepID=UPI0010139443|nr:hypothetical protein [Methylibium sp. Pch-M]QAZ39393.1 hypothetical protein C1M51_08090 [Methylibium sp. Pch-M]
MRHLLSHLAVMLLLAALAAAIALPLSLRTATDTAFTLTANTDVLSVEPLCDQELVWDLGRAEAVALGAGATAPGRGASATSVHLRGGARAVLERRPDGLWRIDLTRGPLHARCIAQTGQPAVVVTVDDQVLELPTDPAKGPRALSVRTTRPAAAGPQKDEDDKPSGTVLLLSGRVVLGELLRHGGGWQQTTSPLLREGKLEARTREPFTDRSVPVIEEALDAGSRVDTHACLMHAEAPAQLACLGTTPVSATGIVYDNKDRALDVKLHVTTARIGIAQHGGEQRAVAVTWWNRFVSLQFVQMFAATLLLLGTLAQTVTTLPGLFRPAP